MSLLGTSGTSLRDLLGALISKQRPDLLDILGIDGVFAHLTVVRDRFLATGPTSR